MNRFYQVAKRVMYAYYRVFYKLEVEGLSNVDPNAHYVVCGNHINLQDPLVVASVLPMEVRFMAKNELFKNPILRWVLNQLGVFSVERDANDLKAIKTALSVLKNNQSLGLFPEATRNKTFKPLPVKAGVAMLAHRTETPILPIAIDSTFKWFKPLRIVVHPPKSLEVYYGQKLSSQELEEISQGVIDHLYTDMRYYR